MARAYTNSRDYWKEREQNHIREGMKNDEEIKRRLNRKYQEAMDDIQKEIESFYGRYSSREGLSMEEARKRVTKLDIEKYERKAKRYVKERNFTDIANEEMRLYNVTMRINRLELLKKNIELELLALYSDEERDYQEELTRGAREEFERQAGILGDSVKYSEKHIKSIVNSSFLTAHWSDRLWTNQKALRAELDKLLNRGIVQGLHPTELARDLRKEIESSRFNSERLLVTEHARVQGDVFKDSIAQSGFDEYIYIAQESACPICEALDDKVFNIDKAQSGVNMYPMHPFCRCSASAYASREAMEKDFEKRGLLAGAIPKENKYNNLNEAYESVRLGSIAKGYQDLMKDRLLDLQNDYPIGEKRIRITNSKSGRAYGFNKAGIVTRRRKGVPYGQFIHQINFSNELMKNEKYSTNSHKRTYKARGSKLADIDTKGLATVDHEYAHAIDNWYVFAKNPDLLEIANEFKDLVPLNRAVIDRANKFNRDFFNHPDHLSNVIRDRMKKDYGMSEKEFMKKVDEEFGSYATTNNKEFLAEGFSMGRFDDEPSEFLSKFMDIFNEEFDKVLRE